jgi:protein-L-isoaspartate(D-aspartate) O-methyltransferase
MVESQVRPNGITDHRIIAAMLELPREDFVPAARRAVAYMDEDILLTTPEGGGPRRYLMEPMTFARLVQRAEIKATDRILHIGATTGYGSAVLAALGGSVVALEEHGELAEQARQNLSRFANVRVVKGPLVQGHAAESPYDVILVEGLIEAVPEALTGQLADGGRLVAVIGRGAVAKVVTISKAGQAFSENRGFDATVGELPGFAARKPEFVF